MSAMFETLEGRQLLSGVEGDAFIAEFDELIRGDMTRDEVAAVMEEAGLSGGGGTYARTEWSGENYWFQTSSGEVWALWHGGAVHDPDGDGAFQWNLTNITQETGVGAGFQEGSLSGTYTPWRAMNVVGLDDRGQVVTYWWSPESGERGMGVNGNGWSLTNLNGETDFDKVVKGDVPEDDADARESRDRHDGDHDDDDEDREEARDKGDRDDDDDEDDDKDEDRDRDHERDDPAFIGITITRMGGDDDLTIEIIVDEDLADDVKIVISFTPGKVTDDGKQWDADKKDRKDLGKKGGADDLVFKGDTTIDADERIKNNIRILDGTLTVLGIVEGNIRQFGGGSVIVDGGLVTGDIDEHSDGSIIITAAGTVEGDATERSDGGIELDDDGLLEGDAAERGDGGIVIDFGGAVSGDATERGEGEIALDEGTLEGHASERGEGGITVTDSTVEGDLEEFGPGSISLLGDTLIVGDVVERGPDDIIIDDLATVRGDVEEFDRV